MPAHHVVDHDGGRPEQVDEVVAEDRVPDRHRDHGRHVPGGDLREHPGDGADRRQVSLALTAEGRSASEAAQAASANYMQALLTGFDEADAGALHAHLSRLVTRLEEHTDG